MGGLATVPLLLSIGRLSPNSKRCAVLSHGTTSPANGPQTIRRLVGDTPIPEKLEWDLS